MRARPLAALAAAAIGASFAAACKDIGTGCEAAPSPYRSASVRSLVATGGAVFASAVWDEVTVHGCPGDYAHHSRGALDTATEVSFTPTTEALDIDFADHAGPADEPGPASVGGGDWFAVRANGPPAYFTAPLTPPFAVTETPLDIGPDAEPVGVAGAGGVAFAAYAGGTAPGRVLMHRAGEPDVVTTLASSPGGIATRDGNAFVARADARVSVFDPALREEVGLLPACAGGHAPAAVGTSFVAVLCSGGALGFVNVSSGTFSMVATTAAASAIAGAEGIRRGLVTLATGPSGAAQTWVFDAASVTGTSGVFAGPVGGALTQAVFIDDSGAFAVLGGSLARVDLATATPTVLIEAIANGPAPGQPGEEVGGIARLDASTVVAGVGLALPAGNPLRIHFLDASTGAETRAPLDLPPPPSMRP